MIVFGGFDGHQNLHDLYLLDTKSFLWTQIDLPGGHPLARSGSAAFMMGPSRMYMMGGYCKVGGAPPCGRVPPQSLQLVCHLTRTTI